MMDSPKFKRKRTSATAPHPAADAASPYAAVKAASQEAARLRAEAEAQRIAKAAEQAKSEEKARRKAEFEERAQVEALRRVKAAREQRAADALKASEDAERQERERQHREAEEARTRQEATKAAQDAAEIRQQAEKRAAKEAARRAQAERDAEDRAASALRDAEMAKAKRLADEQQRAAEAEAKRLAEEAREAAQRKADAEARDAEVRRVEEDARRKAQQAPAPVLPLTDMIPVTRRAEPAPDPAPAPVTPTAQPVADVETAWSVLPELTVEKAHLARNRIITATREDPAHGAFDVLRTRLLQALSENGWRRVAITSPGKDCGKTFTAANLAISLSRQENCRTLLMDLDMRRPSLHRVLGVDSPGSVGDMLRGMIPPETHLHRMGRNPINAGRNIAFALNDRPEAYASELLQDPRSAETLSAIEEQFAPDVVLFDLPPALFYDDVIAARPLFDGVLLVVGGGLTTESEISEVERRLGDSMPILGMVLNKAEGTDISRYTY